MERTSYPNDAISSLWDHSYEVMKSKPKKNPLLRSCCGCFTYPACGMPLMMRNTWRALFPKRLYRHTRGDCRVPKRLITIGFNLGYTYKLSGKLLRGWLCILWLTAVLKSLSTLDKPLPLPLLEYTAIRVSNRTRVNDVSTSSPDWALRPFITPRIKVTRAMATGY